MSTSDPSPVDAARDWRLDVTDSTLLLGLAYVFPSVLGGVVVLAGLLLGRLVIGALLSGRFARAVGLVVAAALALLARRSLPAMLDAGVAEPIRERYSGRGLALGSALGAVVLYGSARLHPLAPFGVFVASWIPLVLTAAFPTTGRADPTDGTLVVDGTEVPLAAVRRVRTVAPDAVAVCWLSYARGHPSAPRVVVVPAAHRATVRDLLARGAAAAPAGGDSVGRPVRLVAGVLGLGMVAVGPLLWVGLPPGRGRAVALYAGATFGLFGAVLLWYAYAA